MSNSDKIEAIKLAAASEFGEETEIFIDHKRVAEIPDPCWQLRKIDYSLIVDGAEGDFYRLDVQRGDVNSHTIFNLGKDITEEEIRRSFEAMNVSYEEYMRMHAGESVAT